MLRLRINAPWSCICPKGQHQNLRRAARLVHAARLPCAAARVERRRSERRQVDALLAFPARIKQDFTQWIVGFPVTINDVDTLVVQGRLASGGFPVKLYFDPKTGLLVRSVRLVNSIVG